MRAPEQAAVFIRDHHERYISWAQYEQNQQIMQSNGGNFSREESVTASRSRRSWAVERAPALSPLWSQACNFSITRGGAQGDAARCSMS
jgi:hypothetical protein